jgi:hypothetical protein
MVLLGRPVTKALEIIKGTLDESDGASISCGDNADPRLAKSSFVLASERLSCWTALPVPEHSSESLLTLVAFGGEGAKGGSSCRRVASFLPEDILLGSRGYPVETLGNESKPLAVSVWNSRRDKGGGKDWAVLPPKTGS